MEYKGRLYARIGVKYVPMDYDSDDWDKMQNEIKRLGESLNDQINSEIPKLLNEIAILKNYKQEMLKQVRIFTEILMTEKHPNNLNNPNERFFEF